MTMAASVDLVAARRPNLAPPPVMLAPIHIYIYQKTQIHNPRSEFVKRKEKKKERKRENREKKR